MFWQMVKGALIRQRGRFILIALTVALGVSLATAMLNVMFDIGEKVNQELKAFGANIMVTPRNSMVLKDLYGVETTTSTHREYLEEEDLGNIKTIFWTNNIVAFAPSLTTSITLVDGEREQLFGTWFEHTLTLPTDETYTTGVKFMKSWWHIDGDWADDAQQDEVLVGAKLAQKLGVSRHGRRLGRRQRGESNCRCAQSRTEPCPCGGQDRPGRGQRDDDAGE